MNVAKIGQNGQNHDQHVENLASKILANRSHSLQIFCSRYVFAPVCRGVTSKRFDPTFTKPIKKIKYRLSDANDDSIEIPIVPEEETIVRYRLGSDDLVSTTGFKYVNSPFSKFAKNRVFDYRCHKNQCRMRTQVQGVTET